MRRLAGGWRTVSMTVGRTTGAGVAGWAAGEEAEIKGEELAKSK